jgi:glycerol-3-phosphate dehydrogenase (NAD+)
MFKFYLAILLSLTILSNPFILKPLFIVKLKADRSSRFQFDSSPLSFNLADFSSRYDNLRFTILGGGSFSLALAKVLSDKSISCKLLVRNESFAEIINKNHYHPKYLSSYTLSSKITACTDPSEALAHCDYVIHAIPMQSSRSFLQNIKNHIKPEVPILSVTKGIEQKTFCLMNEILAETFGVNQKTAYLSGPSFAQEIMNSQATTVVIASADQTLAKDLSNILSSVHFRCHTSSDVKVPNIII